MRSCQSPVGAVQLVHNKARERCPRFFTLTPASAIRSRMPMRFEADVYECEVEGEIPQELEGAYYRTGADRQFPSLEDDIILNGDGHGQHVPLRERPRQLPQPLSSRPSA